MLPARATCHGARTKGWQRGPLWRYMRCWVLGAPLFQKEPLPKHQRRERAALGAGGGHRHEAPNPRWGKWKNYRAPRRRSAQVLGIRSSLGLPAGPWGPVPRTRQRPRGRGRQPFMRGTARSWPLNSTYQGAKGEGADEGRIARIHTQHLSLAAGAARSSARAREPNRRQLRCFHRAAGAGVSFEPDTPTPVVPGYHAPPALPSAKFGSVLRLFLLLPTTDKVLTEGVGPPPVEQVQHEEGAARLVVACGKQGGYTVRVLG